LGSQAKPLVECSYKEEVLSLSMSSRECDCLRSYGEKSEVFFFPNPANFAGGCTKECEDIWKQ
jgi:hypothetical protein